MSGASSASTIAQLQQRLAERDAQMAALSLELEETNKGVVALYAELDDKAAQLSASLELKSRFLYYMSHEFRTPLTAITSISNFLLQRLDGPLNEEQSKQVAFIRASVMELTEMVNDLLDLARVEAGRVTISPEWFEMVDLFSALRGMFKPILVQSSVDLILEETDSLPKIYTDDKKLSQILRNFISNALKFTKDGSVRVSATLIDPEHIEFAVADTGIGISAANLSTLFEDFVQINNPLQKRLRGSGLGLALSRKLANMLGGTVGAESEPGKGSRFWVVIPLKYTGVSMKAGL